MIRTLPRAARLWLFLGAAMLSSCGDDPAQPPADTTPPAIRILTPSAGAVLGQSPQVTLEASDDGGLGRVEVAIYPIGLGGHVESDSIVAASGALGAPYVYTWDTSAVPNGPYAILATAADAAANTASDTVRVSVDIDREPPVVTIVTPADAAVLSGIVDIEIEVTDASRIDSVEVAVYPIGPSGNVESDSIVAASGALATPYAYRWDPSAVPDGPYAILATAVDAVGHAANDTVRVSVDIDREPPVVTIVTPANAAVVSGIVDIEIEATDASPIDSVGVAVYDALGTTVLVRTFTGPPYELSWDTRPLSRGDYHVCAAARDARGQTSAEVCRTVHSYPPRRLQYDDGVIDAQRGTPGSSFQIASLFQNPFDVPVRIDTLECVIGGATTAGAPFRFVVWGTSGRVPTTPVAMSGIRNAAAGQHVGFYTSLGTIIPAGGFFAAGLQQAGSPLLAIGVDTSSIFTTNTFWLATPAGSMNWAALEQLGDIVVPMIRVCVSAVNTSSATSSARVESGYGVRRVADDATRSAPLRPWPSPPAR